jgi:hypothetical protein
MPYGIVVRTTVNLTPDIEAELARLRREQGLGTSEALVLLARRGLNQPEVHTPFRQRTASVGARVDVTNIGDVLEILDDE